MVVVGCRCPSMKTIPAKLNLMNKWKHKMNDFVWQCYQIPKSSFTEFLIGADLCSVKEKLKMPKLLNFKIEVRV